MSKKAAAEEPAHKLFNQFDGMNQLVKLHSLMEKAALDQGMYFSSMSADVLRRSAISTGSLALDLVMGGGHAPGRFTYFFGPTGSGKSTLLYQSLRDPLNHNIPASFLDYEASTDPAYLEKLGIDLVSCLGHKDKKGEWVLPPKLVFPQPNTVEEGFKYMTTILRALPDKVMMFDGDDPRYFLVSPEILGKTIMATKTKTPTHKLNWQTINDGLKNKTVIEVEDGSPQMVFFIDSINAMTPEIIDEDMDNESPALLARALSRQLMSVKGLFGRKMVNLIATNALKINPMAKFGSPETEPGGSAVQYYPDVKVHLQTNRAMGKVIEEPHVSGNGIDRYMLGTATLRKTKTGGTLYGRANYRIWIDELGVPRGGFDPVFDLHNFLTETGQVEDKGSTFRIKIDGFDGTDFSIPAFKEFVLTNPEAAKLLALCRDQLRSGKAQEHYYENIKGRSSLGAKKPPKKGFGSSVGDPDADIGVGADVEL